MQAASLTHRKTTQKTLTLNDKSERLPSQSFSQAMPVLSYGEDKGLEPFIERLTEPEAQTADISKTFEIYHSKVRSVLSMLYSCEADST